MVNILGIETSCDETSVAIVDNNKNIKSNVILDQIELHNQFGGIVPEVASRMHLKNIDRVFNKAFEDSGLTLKDIDAIAVTTGPGLIGGLIVGAMYAKSVAFASKKLLIPINHLEGHALSVRLNNEIEFPYLTLLLSGGHCQILLVRGVSDYQLLGETLDDSLGEAFDKVAKMLGLDYPGGPIIEKLAQMGDPLAFKFPVSMKGRPGCDLSFSGLKTSVRLQIEKLDMNQKIIQDLSASFQHTVKLILIDRLKNAFEYLNHNNIKIKGLALAGGVASNRYIFSAIQEFAESYDVRTVIPPIKLCTDNAAMIAWAGYEIFAKGFFVKQDFTLRSRWPLQDLKN